MVTGLAGAEPEDPIEWMIRHLVQHRMALRDCDAVVSPKKESEKKAGKKGKKMGINISACLRTPFASICNSAGVPSEKVLPFLPLCSPGGAVGRFWTSCVMRTRVLSRLKMPQTPRLLSRLSSVCPATLGATQLVFDC